MTEVKVSLKDLGEAIAAKEASEQVSLQSLEDALQAVEYLDGVVSQLTDALAAVTESHNDLATEVAENSGKPCVYDIEASLKQAQLDKTRLECDRLKAEARAVPWMHVRRTLLIVVLTAAALMGAGALADATKK